jgi:hypothetical protein
MKKSNTLFNETRENLFKENIPYQEQAIDLSFKKQWCIWR